MSILKQSIDKALKSKWQMLLELLLMYLTAPNFVGAGKEVYRSINNLIVLNVDEAIDDYCLMLDNARLNAKVGYFEST